MRFNKLTQYIPDSPVFSTQQVSLFDKSLSTQNIADWLKSWRIVQFKRGWYGLTDRIQSENDFFIIANQLVQPSYVSMESALSIYNLIPEWVPHTTSVSTKKTQEVESSMGVFYYRSLAPKYFWGYELEEWKRGSYYIAKPEKAILDYVYYTHELDNDDAFRERRILPWEFHDLIERDLLKEYLKKFDNKALTKRTLLFLSYIDNA